MDALTRFELRKIMKKKSFYAVIIILIVAVLFLTSMMVAGAWITDKNGSDLKGIAAISLRKKYDSQHAGPLTEEKVKEMINQYQKVKRDPKNLDERGNLSNEAYAQYEVEYEMIYSLIRFAYSPLSEYDHNIIDKLKPDEGNAIYKKRLEIINGYLNFEYSYGNYLEKEKAFFNTMNKRIPVPFQMDYVSGWQKVFQNLRSLFLIISLGIAVCLAPVFSGEYQSGADSIILSSRFGRNKIISAKIKASLSVSLLLVILTLMIYTLLLLGIYGFEGWSASVQMIDFLAPIPYTVFQTYLWTVFIGILACMLISAVTLWLSSHMDSPFSVIIISGFFVIGPLFIPASKSSRLFNHLMDLLPANMFNGFDKVTAYEVFHFFGLMIPEYKAMGGVVIIVIALLIPLAYRAFQKHQVA